MSAYRHLIGEKVSFQVEEGVSLPSCPGSKLFERWRCETVVDLASRVSADGSSRNIFAVMESGVFVPVSCVFIETLFSLLPREAA